MNDFEDATRDLVVEAICGLSNRLQGLVSAIRLARIAKRRLRVIWGNFHPLQIQHSTGRLSDFVDSKFDDVEGGWSEVRIDGPAISLCNGPQWIDWDWGPMPPRPLRIGDTLPASDNSSDAVLCIVTKGPVILEGERFDEVEPDLAKIFCSLQPCKFIRKAVASFIKDEWRANILGVHIRRGDLLNLVARCGKRLTPIEAYCAAVDDKLEFGFDNIYVASDDLDVWPLFVRRYGRHRCLRYSVRSLDRQQVDAVQDAFVELLLLSKTRHILGTRYSSFSRMAAWPKLAQGGLLSDHLSVIRPSNSII